MKKEELHDFLLSQGYYYERDSEYNRDVFTKKDVEADGQKAKIEIFADYYTVKIVWWYRPHCKVATSAYIKNVDEGILQLLIKGLIDSNKPAKTTCR